MLEAGFVREGNAQMKQFIASVNEVRGLFGIIEENTAKLEQMVQTALGVVRENELNRHLNQIDGLISEINRYTLNARGRIKGTSCRNSRADGTELWT